MANEWTPEPTPPSAQTKAAAQLLEAAFQARAVLRTAGHEAEPDTPKARVIAGKIALLSDAISQASAAGIERAIRQPVQ